ncbi:MAG: peptide deformylase [Pseudonocardiaceae bacterium]
MEYTYTVGDDKWGNWFRRAIRLPTRRLSVTLNFPTRLDPAVWGQHTYMTAESMQTAIQVHRSDDRAVYSWSTEDPPLHARYRLRRSARQPAHHRNQRRDRRTVRGVLSFFDVRCRIGRPLVIHVEHQDVNGDRRITIFERGVARLVTHEIDHLHGILRRDHLPAGLPAIPVEQYRGTGIGWSYQENSAIS